MSTFTWFDYRESDRQRALDVIALFKERETRDELGLGSIRDGLADHLFPGTSTIQTRARYFLFVPWIYLRLERNKVSSADITQRGRKEEIRLIEALRSPGADEADGVIGARAGARLKRLPSSIYWNGLHVLGIRLFAGSQANYHQWLDHYYRQQRSRTVDADAEAEDRPIGNWHAGLPDPPADFPTGVTTLALRPVEAAYLRERILTCAHGSLLAFFVKHGLSNGSADQVWQAVSNRPLPHELQRQINHARCFSLTLHGAALLYNLLLAEKSDQPDNIETYRDRLATWGNKVQQEDLRQMWDRADFWRFVEQCNPRVPTRTQQFVRQWLDLVLSAAQPGQLAESADAHALIREREWHLKRSHARLHNPRALELWSGAAGAAPLDFRWPAAQRIIQDILAGLAVDA